MLPTSMSGRVRFSEDCPGVTYVPGNKHTTSLVRDLLSQPMPPLHVEANFQIDIFTAASVGDVQTVDALLNKQASLVASKNKSSWTALLYAAYLGHHNVCQVLLDKGAKIDESNRKGQTALMLSSACGNKEVVKVLLGKGADVTKKDRYGRTALHHASSCSQNDVVDLLLAARADPNAPDNEGMTPLLEACVSGHELTLISLIEKGGDVRMKNSRGDDGYTLAGDSPKLLQILKEKKNERFQGGFVVGRYHPRLQEEKLDLKLFFSLTEKDLDEMGVAYGPKKKMLAVIDRYRATGKIVIDSYEALPVRQPIAPPPPYSAASAPTGGRDETSELKSSLRYIRDHNERTKQLTMDVLLMLKGTSTDNERIRPFLAAIIDEMEKISTRCSKHSL